MHNNKERISVSWMKSQMMVDIFNHHKVSRKKFHEYFAQQIIAYFADVLLGKQKIGNCPIMNKFIDYMIERHISVREIFLICMEFRASMIAELTTVKLLTSENMELIDALSHIFNQNLAGVLDYYQNKCLNISDDISTPDFSEYELEFQAFLEQQENPAITFNKKNLMHANSAFLNIIHVENIEEFNTKYKTPWEIFDSFEFVDKKFKDKEYEKWLEEVLNNKESVNKIFIREKNSKGNIPYRVLVSEVPCKICEESNKYIMTFYPNLLNEELAPVNYIDALTNLPNRLKFEQVLETKLALFESKKEAISIIVAKIKDLENINQIYGIEMGDVVLQEFADQVVDSFSELGLFARIDGDMFALMCDNTTKESAKLYANSILVLGRSIIFDETIDLHPKFSIAVINFVDKETKTTLQQRIKDLIQDVDEHGSDQVRDDMKILEKEFERIKLQKKFLQDCRLIQNAKSTLNTVNFYKELPIESQAKILRRDKNSLLLSLRSIAMHSLKLGSELFIKRDAAQKDIRSNVLTLDRISNTVEIGEFQFVSASPLKRRSIHVEVEKHIPVTLKHDKKQQVAYLKSISIDTVKILLPNVCSFSLNHDINMDMVLEWKGNKKTLSLPVEVIKVGNESKGVFNVIFKLLTSPKDEESIQSYVSFRQREIVQELHALES